jgi:hypothetical protein
MPPRESQAAVETMFKMPNNPVAKAHFVGLLVPRKKRVEQNVQRNHLLMPVHMVAYLPAETSPRSRYPDTLGDYLLLEA